MSVKTLLDDAAAEATIGLRVDLAGAQRQADRHRALVRRRASATMASAVAVAAVVTLIAVLMPGGVFRAFGPAPAAGTSAPTGLPDHWYYAPQWTPPVTRHPMAAASMVLNTSLSDSGNQGAVLVSADGKEYASLPWSDHDEQVALSADGRDVAWVTQVGPSGEGPNNAVVHRLRLRDGKQQDVELSGPAAGMHVVQVLWASNRLYVSARAAAGGGRRTWYLNQGSDELKVLCSCSPLPLGVDGQGRLVQPEGLGDNAVPGMTEVPAAVGLVESGAFGPEAAGDDALNTDRVASPVAVVDPTGTRTAAITTAPGSGAATPPATESGSGEVAAPPQLYLRIAGGKPVDLRIPIIGFDPVDDARVLAWSEAGILVRVHSTSPAEEGRESVPSTSLRIFAPDGRIAHIVSRRSSTPAVPVAVASGVVAGGVTVPGVVPTFSTSDRSHLRYLMVLGRRSTGYEFWALVLAGLAAFVGLPIGLWIRRRRRSEERDRETEPAT